MSNEKLGIIQRQPATLNDLRNTQFKLVIQKIPNVVFFAQNVVLPGIQIGVVDQSTPIGRIPRPGDYSLDEISVNFLVDENLHNWLEIYKWIRESTNVGNYEDYNREEIYSDASIVTLTSHANYNREFVIKSMFPVSLSGIEFDSTSDNSEPVIANVTFRYMLLEVKCEKV